MINETEPNWTEVRQNEQQDFITTILTYAEAHAKPTAEDYNALELYWEGGALEQAMQTAHDLQQHDTVIRLMTLLDNYLYTCGHWKEYHQYLPWAREAAKQIGDEYAATVFHEWMAGLLINLGQFTESRQIYEQSLVIWLKQGRQENTAVIYHQLGIITHTQGDYATAKNMYEQAMVIWKQLGHEMSIAISYHQLALLSEEQGDTATAKRMYKQSLAIKQQLGNQAGIATTIGQLANLAEKEGDLPQAEAMYQQAMKIWEQLGDVVNTSIAIFDLAMLYEDQGRLAEAVPLLERAVAIAERVGLPTKWDEVLARVRGKVETTAD